MLSDTSTPPPLPRPRRRPPPPDGAVSIGDAAQLAGLSIASIRRAIASGALPTVGTPGRGGRLYVPVRALPAPSGAAEAVRRA